MQQRLRKFLCVLFIALGYCSIVCMLPGDIEAKEKAAISVSPVLSADEKTIIGMTAYELRHSFPTELQKVEFAQNQDELNPLLAKIGERVESFFRYFSNTSSKEEVLLKRLGYNDRLESSIIKTFNYLILFNPDNERPLIQEYRTDKNHREITREAINGFYITTGYSCLSGVLFYPKYFQNSNFRYVGRESSGSQFYIIAFAQKSDNSDRNLATFTDTEVNQSVRVPLQGIVWVNPDTYQIVRIKTILATATNQSFKATQETDIQYGEIRFASAPQSYWLPTEVIVRMGIGGKTYSNLHRYSNYQLFNVDSSVISIRPKSSP